MPSAIAAAGFAEAKGRPPSRMRPPLTGIAPKPASTPSWESDIPAGKVPAMIDQAHGPAAFSAFNSVL